MKALLSIVLSLVLSAAVTAQVLVRPIPANAPKAKMYVVSERVLNLNGLEFTLAPGGIIYSDKNLIVLTSALPDTYPVRVSFDNQGMLRRVWILTAEEAAVEAPEINKKTRWWWPF